MFHITFTETLPVDRRQERFGYFHRMLLYRKNSLFFVRSDPELSVRSVSGNIYHKPPDRAKKLLLSERIFLVFSIEYI
jgi:hypothetical protein